MNLKSITATDISSVLTVYSEKGGDRLASLGIEEYNGREAESIASLRNAVTQRQFPFRQKKILLFSCFSCILLQSMV